LQNGPQHPANRSRNARPGLHPRRPPSEAHP
jgi:hypothetical protein